MHAEKNNRPECQSLDLRLRRNLPIIMKKPAKASIEVQGTVVNIVTQKEENYICSRREVDDLMLTRYAARQADRATTSGVRTRPPERTSALPKKTRSTSKPVATKTSP